jgi:hypothetical protein
MAILLLPEKNKPYTALPFPGFPLLVRHQPLPEDPSQADDLFCPVVSIYMITNKLIIKYGIAGKL